MSDNSEQYNRGGLWAFVLSMSFIFCFMVYLVTFHKGVILDEKVVDPKGEGAAALSFDLSKVAEPWVSSPEMITHGKKLFVSTCALCHGNEAKGDGPGGMGLNPRPRNIVEGKWTQGGGLTDHFKVVSNGIPNSSMASFKGQLTQPERWAIVHFMESVTQNKSKEDSAKVAEFAKSYKD